MYPSLETSHSKQQLFVPCSVGYTQNLPKFTLASRGLACSRHSSTSRLVYSGDIMQKKD